jgi:hypothetical protein
MNAVVLKGRYRHLVLVCIVQPYGGHRQGPMEYSPGNSHFGPGPGLNLRRLQVCITDHPVIIKRIPHLYRCGICKFHPRVSISRQGPEILTRGWNFHFSRSSYETQYKIAKKIGVWDSFVEGEITYLFVVVDQFWGHRSNWWWSKVTEQFRPMKCHHCVTVCKWGRLCTTT